MALAFGLTVLTMAYAVGHVSGAHFNPAVTVGLATAGRMPWSTVPGYIVAQVLGGIAAARGALPDRQRQGGLRGRGRLRLQRLRRAFAGQVLAWSPRSIIEVVLTAMFLVVILGVTHKNAPAGFAPLAIGLALTLIHLISIPVTNTSVNPARSTAVALFAEPWALQQLWLFWVAPDRRRRHRRHRAQGDLGGLILTREPDKHHT